MPAALSIDDVRKVAHLARLKLTDAELESYTRQLADVLQYVELLDSVETANVEPLAHPHEIANVLRADEPAPSLLRDAALANAPQSDGKYFLVPAILDAAS
jgi:aspartyl-tRNA(Asn)/glutamyl-tRNA(Gln) amidotransferase subunit C